MIDVLFTGNKYVFRGMALGILSILDKTKEEPIHFHIMTMACPWDPAEKLSYEWFLKIKEVVQKISPESDCTYYDISDDFTKELENSPNKKPMYQPASLIRLFALRYLKCDKVIYLDCDTMANKSLMEFKKHNIDDYEIGVALDHLGKIWQFADYFNSGVMYINVKKCNETGLFERAIEMLKVKWLYFADQTALYRLSTSRYYFPQCFNEQRRVKDDTVIKHFNLAISVRYPYYYNIKQWHVYNLHKKLKMFMFDDIFKQYDEYFGDVWSLDYNKK